MIERAEVTPDEVAPELNPFNTVALATWRRRAAAGDDAATDDGAGRAESIEIPARVEVVAPQRIAALVPVEPERGGLGTPRALDSTFAGRTVLQRTLERIGAARAVDEIVLLAPDDLDVEPLIERDAIHARVVVERCGPSPHSARQEAVVAARMWCDTSWRGGIAEASIFDEVLDATVAWPVIERRGLDAVVLCGPDWPLVDVSATTGIDALVAAHRADPAHRRAVASPAPPGLGACVIHRSLLRELAGAPTGPGAPVRMLGACIRALTPDADGPHGDVHPSAHNGAARDGRLARSLVRATFDTPRYKLRLRRAVEALVLDHESTPDAIASRGLDAAECIGAIEHQWLQLPTFTPPHLVMELCTGRLGSGAASPHRRGSIQRPPMPLRLAERILAQAGECRDTVLTLAGAGDPLRHPDFEAIVRLARACGVRGIHVRTELVGAPASLDRVLAAEVDVVSVDLHAATPQTYAFMHGVDRHAMAIGNIERLAERRRRVGSLALPWIVPRMQLVDRTLPEADAFATHWTRRLGAVLLEPPQPVPDDEAWPPSPDAAVRDGRARSRTDGGVAAELDARVDGRLDSMALGGSAATPARAILREGLRRMTILSDGSVPVSELDAFGDEESIGNLARVPLLDAWRDLFARRRQLRRQLGETAAPLRLASP